MPRRLFNNNKRSELQAVHPFQRWLLFGVATVAALALGGMESVWGYHYAKVWRARQLATEATDSTKSHDKAEYEAKLMAAYNLAPLDPVVLRNCARNMARAGNPHALGFYHLLLLLPNASRDDKREAAMACLNFGDIQAAMTVVDDLVASRGYAQNYSLQAQVLYREQNAKQAIATMCHSLELDPSSNANKLLLAEMLALSGTPEGESEAVSILEVIAKLPDQDGLWALVLLAHDRNLEELSMRGMMDRLRSHPLLDDGGRLTAWELELRLDPHQQKKLFQQVVDYFKAVEIMRRMISARWLYEQGSPESVLQLAPLADAMGNQNLFLVREDSWQIWDSGAT